MNLIKFNIIDIIQSYTYLLRCSNCNYYKTSYPTAFYYSKICNYNLCNKCYNMTYKNDTLINCVKCKILHEPNHYIYNNICDDISSILN